MFGLGRGKDKEEGIPEIPNEVVAMFASKFFEMYGEEFARLINSKIAPRFEAIENKLKEHDKIIELLKETSDSRLKMFIREFLEAHDEALVEKSARTSAREVIQNIGLDKVEQIHDRFKDLERAILTLEETVEKASKILDNVAEVAEKLSKQSDELWDGLGSIKEDLKKTIQGFNEEVQKATKDAVKHIKENVVVDKSMIESVVESTLAKIVNTKMEKFERPLDELSMRLGELDEKIGKNSKDVEELKLRLDEILATLESLKEEIENMGGVKIPLGEQPSSEEIKPFEE